MPFPIGEKLPYGTVDCHFHIFGPAKTYLYAPDRSYTPPDASLADYEKLAFTLGITRSVIVQPSPYGFHNERTLTILRESTLPMRAVVVVNPDVSDDVLLEYHACGVRGIRVNLLFGAGAALNTVDTLADRIRGLGWHIQFLADVSEMEELPSLIRRLRVPVVFDHLGHLSALKTIYSKGFEALRGLLRDGTVWVKLSAPYRMSSFANPPHCDVRPFAEALIDDNPKQLLWGTDWPHPAISVPMPDDTDLIKQFCVWIGDEWLQRRIFVVNPEAFYGFPALETGQSSSS